MKRKQKKITFMNKTILSLLLSGFLAIISCSVNPPVNAQNSNPNRTVFKLKIPANNITESSVYRLGYGDSIEIKFFNNPEYNETVTVRPDGRITLPRVGDVYVIQMTPSELDDIITQTYSEILLDPDVTVIVRDFGGQDVYVMGEVENPGIYPLTKGMTMLRAIAVAGGPKGSAKLGSVILIRNDGNQTGEALRVDLALSSVRKNLNKDLPVQGFDMIYVPRTFISDLNSFITQFYDVLLPPFDVWSRYTYWYNRK
ncbi:polysaccharide export protein [candidate division KSB1 bacterium]|nr:polysaccharide export protein [candidate division KSB1 bacterium]